jgi:class 3 adenylate cyclase
VLDFFKHYADLLTVEKRFFQFDRLWDFLEEHSRKGPEPFGALTRYGLMVVLATCLAGAIVGVNSLLDKKRFYDPAGYELAGNWDFYNGPSNICSDPRLPARTAPCLAKDFDQKWPLQVKVPLPLQDQVKEKLADEFWYRKKFTVPAEILQSKESLSITLGAIKGPHSVWVNGEFLGAGPELGVANYILPKSFISKDGVMIITVKVGKYETLFRGIVHGFKMQIGATKFLQLQEANQKFNLVARPLIGLVIKGSIFFIFALLFAVMPIRREYFLFSLYAFFSAMNVFFNWMFSPIYEQYFLRQLVAFSCQLLAVVTIPIFIVEFFRLNKTILKYVYAYSASVVLMMAAAWGLVHEDKKVLLYDWFYANHIYITHIPALIGGFIFIKFLRSRVRVAHRILPAQFLIGAFCINVITNLIYMNGFLRFTNNFIFYEFIDLVTFFIMAFVMAGEFKAVSNLFIKSKNLLPSMVAKLTSAGVQQAIVEIRAVVLVADVVSYTKTLKLLSTQETDVYNHTIKERLQGIIQSSGGEKISDTGDGGVFIWEYKTPEQRASALQSALRAGLELAAQSKGNATVKYRVALAAGALKCHVDYPNYGYVGDPIIEAARLQDLATVGNVLVSESITRSELGIHANAKLRTEKIKGAEFRAFDIAS